MALYDIIDEITERQVTKTETGDNRIWGVMVGIVAKNFDPNSSAGGGTGSNSGADAMDGRVCVTIPTRDKKANELKWARVAMPSGGSKWGHYFLPEVGDQVLLAFEGGNIEKPYVIGCVQKYSNAFLKKAVDKNNQFKKIVTRHGSHITFGLLERYDCLDWANWVSTHTVPGLPVYLAGISMGATTVLLAGGLELPDRVKGIVADCGFTSPHSIWKHVAERNLHLNYDLHHSWAERLFRRRLHMSAEEVSTLSSMEKCQVPVLFIHGSDDSFVPVEMTYENYKACAAPKELLIVPGAGHGLSYLVETERYQQALQAFWQAHDK